MKKGILASEWSTVILVVLGLLAAEVTVRSTRSSLSLDIAHLDRVDSLVESLDGQEGLAVLLSGNSLLRAGVDGDVLETGLEEELGRSVSVAMVHPDGSNPLEWQYLHRKIVHYPGRRPDVVVLAFGPGQLRDRSAETGLLRLAAHHVDRRDVVPALRNTFLDTELRSKFVLARVSNAFAFRDRIAPRVLDLIIPGYRERAEILLQAPASAPTGQEAQVSEEDSYSVDNLERLLADYADSGIELLALPMPAPQPYELEAKAGEVFAAFSAPLVTVSIGHDARRFPDGQHLDDEGRRSFTAALTPVLAAELRRIEGG